MTNVLRTVRTALFVVVGFLLIFFSVSKLPRVNEHSDAGGVAHADVPACSSAQPGDSGCGGSGDSGGGGDSGSGDCGGK